MELEAQKDDFGEMGRSDNELRNNFYSSISPHNPGWHQ